MKELSKFIKEQDSFSLLTFVNHYNEIGVSELYKLVLEELEIRFPGIKKEIEEKLEK